MQQTKTRTVRATVHHWTSEEKEELSTCDSTEKLYAFARAHNLCYSQVYGTYKNMQETHISNMPTFDYTKIQPLRALFTRCPVCGGTTTVNANAYCHSCCTQWHALTLQPITYVDSDGKAQKLHAPDRIE